MLSLEELSKDSVSIDRKNVLPKGAEGKDSARETKRKSNKLIRQGNRTKAISLHIGAGMNYFGVSDLNYPLYTIIHFIDQVILDPLNISILTLILFLLKALPLCCLPVLDFMIL